MKKTITQLSMALAMLFSIGTKAQTQTVNFDNFTLAPNSYFSYTKDTVFRDGAVKFNYIYSFGYWMGGSAYTNVKDTADGSFNNLYGNSAFGGFSGDNYASVQAGAIISFSNTATLVSGFYINNTTYAWKEMKNGGFGRKFGDTTGTGSGASIPQGEYPDWFKILVKGYKDGSMLTDSVEFYLADYRPAGTTNDYIVKNWQFVNCSSLGIVDSITFVMKSTDNNSFGMKTPAFFSMDDLTITQNPVGIDELANVGNMLLYPNPTQNNITLSFASKRNNVLSINISDLNGKQVIQQSSNAPIGDNALEIPTSALQAGVYVATIDDGASSKKIRFIKL